MSDAFSGIGTSFKRWDSSSAVADWVALAEVNSISGPGMSRETIDVTSLDSTGGYREIIGALRSGGDVSLSMNFTRTNYELMKTDFESNTLQNYQIALPDTDNTCIEFTALVMELPLSITVDDKVTIDVTITISGQPTVSSGGSDSI
ncbi:MAG: phage tail tube protein [Desulfobacteraceae bacterium]|jgi:predicted secreted protein